MIYAKQTFDWPKPISIVSRPRVAICNICNPIHINAKNMLARMNPGDEVTIFIK
jgi:hypothetical protein